ncbi:hypothetical protein MRB53_010292 [Persea americana]|uniref:Uncharacterized protein n=1 Tax=Persea americana TaxID=3435 RepID=A0ACC2LRL6_PERAE|nr:hypothetical protein MRB53_010292 [Persea americana]
MRRFTSWRQGGGSGWRGPSEGGKCPRGRVKVERSGRVGVLIGGGDGGRPNRRQDGRPGTSDRVSVPWVAHGFFLVVEQREGQNGKMEKMDAGEEFSGFVQSGWCTYLVINEVRLPAGYLQGLQGDWVLWVLLPSR